MAATKDILAQTVSRILGEAAFIFTDALDDNAKPPAESWDAEGVSLTFAGKASGELRMWVGSGFARLAAANMLGIDAPSEEARQKGLDALKELINMVVGNYITAAFGDSPVFDLGLPKRLSADQLAKDFGHPEAVWLEAEGNPLLLVIETQHA